MDIEGDDIILKVYLIKNSGIYSDEEGIIYRLYEKTWKYNLIGVNMHEDNPCECALPKSANHP